MVGATEVPVQSVVPTLLWLGTVILGSVVYRHLKRKPLRPKPPQDATFVEYKAGAPFASRCLLVTVDQNAIRVGPTFPFNLMFLPEIFGAEYEIGLEAVRSVSTGRYHFGLLNTAIAYGDGKRRLLRLKRPNSFFKAVTDGLN